MDRVNVCHISGGLRVAFIDIDPSCVAHDIHDLRPKLTKIKMSLSLWQLRWHATNKGGVMIIAEAHGPHDVFFLWVV